MNYRPQSTKSATQIMQNKPNFLNARMNVTSVLTKDYENKPLCGRGQNKPNQTQLNPISNPIEPNLPNARMNVTSVLTKDYENHRPCRQSQNKPNQTQSAVSLSNLFQSLRVVTSFYITLWLVGFFVLWGFL